MKSPEQGAATSVYAALSEDWKHKGSMFLSSCVEQKPFAGNQPLVFGDDGYVPWAYDEAGEKKL